MIHGTAGAGIWAGEAVGVGMLAGVGVPDGPGEAAGAGVGTPDGPGEAGVPDGAEAGDLDGVAVGVTTTITRGVPTTAMEEQLLEVRLVTEPLLQQEEALAQVVTVVQFHQEIPADAVLRQQEKAVVPLPEKL